MRGIIFEALGRVSVLFSTLEAELGDLVCLLADPEEPLLAATLIERNTFSRTIELLEKIGRFKNGRIEGQIARLLAVAAPLRKRRNLFVHGCWDISPRLLGQGKVIVSDSKIQFERNENRKSWRKGTDHTISLGDLHEYETEVMRALKMARELFHALEKEGS